MAKQRSGLHKEIASIFDGVPLPAKKGNGEGDANVKVDVNGKGSATATAQRPAGHLPPRPTVPPPKPQLQVVVKEPVVKPIEAAESTIEKMVGPSALQIQLQKLSEIIKEKVLAPKPGESPARHMAMIVLMPMLFIIMIFVFGRMFVQTGNKPNKATPQAATPVAQKASDQINWETPAPYPMGLRDPMTRYSSSVNTDGTATAGSVVKGILFSDNPSAIIGKQIVRVGAMVDGAKITEITRDSVTFEKEGKQWTEKVQR